MRWGREETPTLPRDQDRTPAPGTLQVMWSRSLALGLPFAWPPGRTARPVYIFCAGGFPLGQTLIGYAVGCDADRTWRAWLNVIEGELEGVFGTPQVAAIAMDDWWKREVGS